MKDNLNFFTINELYIRQAHIGTTQSNSNFNSIIYGLRNRIAIIDLEKTSIYLKLAIGFLINLLQTNTNTSILFVGTNFKYKWNEEDRMYFTQNIFFINHWIGGLLTNFESIHAFEIKEENIELESIYRMKKLPDLMIMLDDEPIAVKEANKWNIPVIGILDTNSKIKGVDYIIPSNNNSLSLKKFYQDLFLKIIVMWRQKEIVSKWIE